MRLLYTIAKGCEHRISRVLEVHLNAIDWKVENEFVWVFKCNVITYCHPALNQMLFHDRLSRAAQQIIANQGL